MPDTVGTRTLRLASRTLGGPKKLREHLGVTASDLAAWLTGQREPPREVLLEALAVILDDLDKRD